MTAIRWTGNQYEVDYTCPHCSRATTTVPRALYQTERNRTDTLHTCPGCRQPIIVVVSHNDGAPSQNFRIHSVFPMGKIDDSVPEEIDYPVREDFREAKRCFAVKAYKGAVTMCRRIVQVSAIALGASAGKRLVDQIDEITAKQVITPTLQRFAHEIRSVGNAGAHPSEDLDEINEEDAKDILEFTDQFLEHVYVMPKKLEKRKAARTPKP
jgi:uncharacterized protein DUF4145